MMGEDGESLSKAKQYGVCFMADVVLYCNLGCPAHRNELGAGPIPKELGNLVAVREMDLANNSLSGESVSR